MFNANPYDLPRMELVLSLSEAQRHAIEAMLRQMDDEFQPDFQQRRRMMISERERLFRALGRPHELPEG
ncbi:MAG: hypothetical protein ACRECQ_19515, partial [Burkholderiaceae bacterium]